MIKLKVFKEISFLWIGSLLGALAAFVVQILLARNLGVEHYGAFSVILAIVALLVPVVSFGVAQFWLKAYGGEGWEAQRWLKSSYEFLVMSSVIVFIAIFIIAFLADTDEKVGTLVLWVLPLIFGQVVIELISARLQLEERFLLLAFWQLLPHLMRLLFVLIILFFFKVEIDYIAIIYALISLGFIAVGFYFLIMMNQGKWDLKGGRQFDNYSDKPKPKLNELIGVIWPFGLATFFSIVYYQSDIIFLKYMVNDGAAGYYNVAYSIMAAIYLLPAVIYQKYLLPKIHRWSNHDKEKFYQVYAYGNKAMLVLGVLSTFGVWILAFWGVPLLFGVEYKNSVLILNILAISLPVIFLAFNSGAVLVTKENMKKKVKYMGITALLNIVLNFILIPTYHELGAAIATILSYVLLVYLYYYGTKRYVFKA